MKNLGRGIPTICQLKKKGRVTIRPLNASAAVSVSLAATLVLNARAETGNTSPGAETGHV